MVADRRRGRRATMRSVFPEYLAVLLVQGEDGAGVVDDVDPAVGDHRRELEQRTRAEGPDRRPSIGRVHLETERRPQAGGGVAVQRAGGARRVLFPFWAFPVRIDRGRDSAVSPPWF